MKKTVFFALVLLGFLLSSCSGPTQAQYDAAMKNLGVAETRVKELEAENKTLSDSLEKTRNELLASEARAAQLSSQLGQSGAANEGVIDPGAVAASAGSAVCSQTWDLIANENLIAKEISAQFLATQAQEDGFQVFLTQYQVASGAEGAQFTEGLPFFILVANSKYMPGKVVDIIQGCVILAPQDPG